MSDYIFQPFVVISNAPTRDAIALKYIESMTIATDGLEGLDKESLVVEKLQGDCHLFIRTISGKEYTISMLQQLSSFTKYSLPTDVNELRQIIFDKWYKIISVENL